jgi:hypothetical protein
VRPILGEGGPPRHEDVELGTLPFRVHRQHRGRLARAADLVQVGAEKGRRVRVLGAERERALERRDGGAQVPRLPLQVREVLQGEGHVGPLPEHLLHAGQGGRDVAALVQGDHVLDGRVQPDQPLRIVVFGVARPWPARWRSQARLRRRSRVSASSGPRAVRDLRLAFA